jgi:hypothetical protein
MATTLAEPARGYLLSQDAAGEWSCPCFVYKWRHRCVHVQAAEHWLGSRPPGPLQL